MHLPWKHASRKNLHPATLQVLTKTLEFKELQIWQSPCWLSYVRLVLSSLMLLPQSRWRRLVATSDAR